MTTQTQPRAPLPSGLNRSEVTQFVAIAALALVAVAVWAVDAAPLLIFIAAGLAVAGMPLGSPGMEVGDRKEPYDVVLFERNGKTRVYARR